MTIAIVLKVGDGLVLGADSATTLGQGNSVVNSWFSAEKVFNLVKGLPLGVVTAGLAGIDGRSINALAKDLRSRLSDPANADWYLPPATYTMQDAAEMVRRYFYEEMYLAEAGNYPDGQAPTMHFLVAGYSAGARESEVWSIDVDPDKKCTVACPIPIGVSATAAWRGLGEAIDRIVRGYSSAMYAHLVRLGVGPADAVRILTTLPVPGLMHPAMPIQDLIDFARYLLNATADFVRFAPGPPLVHAPFDLAAITPHEHFRWIERKHYFPRSLNRPIDRYRLAPTTTPYDDAD